MQKAMLFKKFLMPCGLCAAVPAFKTDAHHDDSKPCCEKSESKNLVRPSVLPIYSVEDSCSKGSSCKRVTPSALEEQISYARKSIQSLFVVLDDMSKSVSTFYNTGLQHSSFMLDYLQEEENLVPRVGAIAIGGLSGVILGLRGGKIRKLFYGSVGAAAAAAVCYPKQAQEQFQVARHYAEIGVHFLLGTTAEDAKEVRKSLQEFNISQIGDKIKENLDISSIYSSLQSKFSSKQEENRVPQEPRGKQE